MNILILNGPNLHVIGTREPKIYGSRSFDSFYQELSACFQNIRFSYFQSNHEGELIDRLYQAQEEGIDGVVFNAGAYTHTSLALADAIRAVSIPVVEVHISNVASREEIRRTSLIASACVGSISGFGLFSYTLGCYALLDHINKQVE